MRTSDLLFGQLVNLRAHTSILTTRVFTARRTIVRIARYCHSNPVCLSVTLMHCDQKTSRFISPLHYTAHRSNSRRGISPILGERRRGTCNSGICDTKLSIYLKRSSVEPKLLQSVYRNSCTAYRLVTNLETYLAYFSVEQNFPTTSTLFVGARRNLALIQRSRGRHRPPTMRRHASVLH